MSQFQPTTLRIIATPPPPPAPSARDLVQEQLGALRQLFADLQQAATDLRAAREALLAEAPAQLAEVALMLAEQIAAHAIATTPEIIVQCAERALKESVTAAAVQLQFHPDDHAFLQQQVPEALAALAAPAGVQVQENAELPRGVVRIEAEQFRIEGGMPLRLAHLWKELFPAGPAAGGAA